MLTTEKIVSVESLGKAPEHYDLVILGGGTGSTVAAWTSASEGKRVAVVDRKYIGGSPTNRTKRSPNCFSSISVGGCPFELLGPLIATLLTSLFIGE